MIAAGEPQEFVPYGHHHLAHHPGDVYLPVDVATAVGTAADSSRDLLRALKGVSIQDYSEKETWQIRDCSDKGGEEELYMAGHTVVWSSSSGYGTRKVYKAFTMENPVQHVSWCSFYKDSCKPRTAAENSFKDDEGKETISGICIIEMLTLSMFCRDGQDFTVALPFEVSKIWVMKYGFLFVRAVSDTDGNSSSRIETGNLPLVFSMLHPLDEVVPVVKRTGGPAGHGKLNFCTHHLEEIVYTNVDPSLVIIYHKPEGVHSVWKLRRTTDEEANLSYSKICKETSSCLANTPITHGGGAASSSSSHSRFTMSSHSPNHSTSPYHNHPTSRVASPSMQSRIQSPASNLTHMATLSRSQSPLHTTNASNRFSFTSPHSHSWSPANHSSPSQSESLFEMVDPLSPDICIIHEWTEPQSQFMGEKAAKVFLTTDVIGQTFLCYHLKEKKCLRLIKFEESNDKTHLIFGTVHSISARDAEPLPSLNLILTLDLGLGLTLYTGSIKICKVHIPSVAGPFSSLPSFSNQYTNFNAATPRRSSLITSSRPPSALDAKFDEEAKLLSPVPLQLDESCLDGPLIDESALHVVGTVTGLRDAVKNNVTVETVNGTYFRISLPEIANSTIVSKCLQALKCVLPRDVAVQVCVKWYATRNAPGPSYLTCQSELNSFLLCLLGMMGYNTEQICLGGFLEQELSFSPVAVKKLKTSEQGCDEDWSYLLSSAHHHSYSREQSYSMDFDFYNSSQNSSSVAMPLESTSTINSSAVLFPYMASVLYSLHLVYEDSKLNILHWNSLPLLASMLFELARDLNLDLYQDFYWRDYPTQFSNISSRIRLSEAELKTLQFPPYFSFSPPGIFVWLQSCLLQDPPPFPYLPNVTIIMRDIVLCYALTVSSDKSEGLPLTSYLQRIAAPGHRSIDEANITLNNTSTSRKHSNQEKVVLFLTHLKLRLEDINYLPVGVSLPLRDAILHCRNHPPSDWPEDAYTLIGRQELAALHSKQRPHTIPHVTQSRIGVDGKHGITKEDEDGFGPLNHEVLRLRFSRDHRLHEVFRMMQSSKPVRIVLQQRPEVGDHEFIEEQERHLYALCIRTMALPVGRGMLTLRTCRPVVTETLPIPKLCLTGRAPPRNTTVDLSHIDVPANMNMWPLFHNGIAAGLRIAPNASQIDSPWIVYNKPRSSSNDTPTEHAGFLMALGLNGHLSNLATMSVHDYLCKGHELTSVGLLLGIAAAKRGSMDVAVTKIMSIHVEALLPPTSTELDVPAVVQVAAVLGIGLLYQGSAHHHMAEVLLGEIGRPPGPEMEHCIDRESYALAAGLALGLVTLGKGSEVSGLSDLPMADQLYQYMVGGHKRPLTGIHKEKHKSPSYQIREGDAVNVDVTSPGATLALGLMFFNTNNSAIAEWMAAPDTQYLLDMVRPDFLLLRTLSRGLIMWEEVRPSKSWVYSHVPEIVAIHAFKKGQMNSDVDYETMSQTYCNIIAGACMALGLKFSGSANQEAFDTLIYYAKMFLNLSGKPVADQAGKSTIETCLNVIALSLAMVMVGTGDLEVLRICRHLRSRVSQASSYVLYGSHMATHMALGLLFLGGGQFTLSTTPEAIGAMVCAFFPKFPTHSNDNRYHLQAFRHLYVLAVEPRLVIPRHIDTDKAIYTHLKIKFRDTSWYKDAEYTVRAPCLLPELHMLEKVEIDDARYWPIIFDSTKNWNTLNTLLNNSGNLYVKQKAGCLPYSEDPQGFRSLLAQNLMKNNVRGLQLKERQWQQKLCDLLFEGSSQEKVEVLPACLALCQMAAQVEQTNHTLGLWQLKLMLAHQQSLSGKEDQETGMEDLSVVKPDLALAIKNEVERALLKLVQGIPGQLLSCLTGQKPRLQLSPHLAPFLVFHNIPPAGTVDLTLTEGTVSLPTLYLQLRHLHMPVPSLLAIISALSPLPTQ